MFKKFKVVMNQGNINTASLKLLVNITSNRILPLSKNLLKQKHPNPLKSSSETLLLGQFNVAHGGINKSLVMAA